MLQVTAPAAGSHTICINGTRSSGSHGEKQVMLSNLTLKTVYLSDLNRWARKY